MLHSDQKYIDALVNNDRVLIEELYQKYSGKIRWLVLQNNGTVTEAADIFQDVLVSIYKKAKTGSFTLTCPLDAFLYVACRNRWTSELNKKKSDKVTNNSLKVYNIDDDSFKLAEEFTLQEERKALLNKKLEELCEDCRKLLRLSWSGKPMKEVAALLNTTYGYARKRKCECMTELIALIKHSSQFNTLKW